MKVLELFSGIGGMHFALKSAGVDGDVVAVEINTVANSVYRHNFPKTKLLQKNILCLSIEELNKISPEMILMSPPCQPFTRVGLQKDLADVRTDPLKHILSLLADLPSVRWVLVENVRGFESSEARRQLVSCLHDSHFTLREFLISPVQVGVPNSRTRYYLLAKREPLAFSFQSSTIMEQLPEEASEIVSTLEAQFPKTEEIADILETEDRDSALYQEHLLPDTLLDKRLGVMDIVTRELSRSCCFTKAYGRYVEGTGSVFCPHSRNIVEEVLANPTPDSVRLLNLRYFTSKEIARLMSFPENFKIPPEITRKQRYQLLGNSLNVKVVALLIRLMLCEPDR